MVVFPEAPFPSYEKTLRNGLEQSRARGVGAAKRTLDGEDRSGTWAERERGRGFQGCPPWPDLGSAHGFACGALTGHQRRAPATALFYAATDPQIPPRARNYLSSENSRRRFLLGGMRYLHGGQPVASPFRGPQAAEFGIPFSYLWAIKQHLTPDDGHAARTRRVRGFSRRRIGRCRHSCSRQQGLHGGSISPGC